MPYISQKARDELIGDTKCRGPETSGELNYMITVLIDQYIIDRGFCYATLGECTSALENAKLEFYRRTVVPYEDMKIEENGEVYQSV